MMNNLLFIKENIFQASGNHLNIFIRDGFDKQISCFHFRQNIQRSDLYQYRLQAWNMTNMEETYLPDFSQSKTNWKYKKSVENFVSNVFA